MANFLNWTLLVLCVSALAAAMNSDTCRVRQATASSATLLPWLHAGQLRGQYHVVLASASPRRRELLELLGLRHFQVQASQFAEDLDKKTFASLRDYCQRTAERKVEHLVQQWPERDIPSNTLVIGADTVVEIDEILLEKPQDDNDAKRMLLLLSGRTHFVHTAVTIFSNALLPTSAPTTQRPVHIQSFVETTKVTFCHLQEADIIAYIALGEGRDKAGSYGIQGFGGQFVQHIEGCYFNVMGLPIHALSRNLSLLLHDAANRNV